MMDMPRVDTSWNALVFRLDQTRAICYDLTSWLGETEVGWGQSRDYSDVG